jgi:predicted nucleic acid-binding protein
MVKAKVYVETTVVSYLAAPPSRDIVVAGHQETTRAWWTRRDRFELFVSQAVVEEASHGNAVAAAQRMALLDGIPVLGLTAEIDAIANQLLRAAAGPAKARIDAIHIAVAAVSRLDYLVTWNLTHIANAAIRGKIEQTCRGAGLQAPVICTPEELLEA